MIVPITGNITYSITLDPTVWIFDDRKVEFDKAFDTVLDQPDEDEDLERTSKRWDRAVSQQHINPPINKSISKLEGEKILKGTYVMPIEVFVNHAEAKADAKTASLIIEGNDDVTISLDQLRNAYLLFAVDGQPLKENGPVHLYHKDGSNRDNPITSIKKIVIN
ncbi:hypothetical protein CFK37_16365 [Virgibacillus phasianinus]|uniref:Peptidyl-prolyl cis-trans isomerase n=1 Tax=Virgibacillus phasianinus TaxID=2017483 RepID=A0A220U698_9BACI|nr:hypothetical protein [Virgibacillus phasianinus]ASK63620.1 hypothetical protein CFK37_16365 [Virgibacillus phasianinus]